MSKLMFAVKDTYMFEAGCFYMAERYRVCLCNWGPGYVPWFVRSNTAL